MGKVIAHGSVKICGNRDPELCRLAAKAGADLLGFIFVPGVKRYVEPSIAAECISSTSRSGDKAPLAVGIFVDERPSRINEIAGIANLDLIQLHGNERLTDLQVIERPVVKVLRPTERESYEEIERKLEAYLRANNAPIAFLIDRFDAKHYGGAGIKANWNLAAKLASNYPILLAGGLDPDNVADAISTVGPVGVDVSTGVETDGTRDAEKIQAFIAAAKQSFANRSLPGTAVGFPTISV
jgi:phosphoribosylanthranilate isomerase